MNRRSFVTTALGVLSAGSANAFAGTVVPVEKPVALPDEWWKPKNTASTKPLNEQIVNAFDHFISLCEKAAPDGAKVSGVTYARLENRTHLSVMADTEDGTIQLKPASNTDWNHL